MKLAKKYCLFEIVFFSLLFSVEILVSAQKSRKLDSCAEVGFECVYNSDCCGVGTCVFEQCTYPTTTGPEVTTRKREGQANQENEQLHPHSYLLPSFPTCGSTYSASTTTTQRSWNSRSRSKRVSGGLAVRPKEFPWLVEIYRRSSIASDSFTFGNTGTLINSRYILTSTEAIPTVDAQGLTLQQSLSHVHVGVSGGQPAMIPNQVNIEKVVTHEATVVSTLRNDIVLLRLSEPVVFNEYTRPICLPTDFKSLNLSGSQLKIAGWGLIGPGLTGYPTPAYHVSMKQIPLEFCDRVYAADLGRLNKSSICARSMSIYRDGGLCRGDAGDPLMLESLESGRELLGKKTTQVGIASYSNGCGKQGFPSVFVNVSKYLPWILDNIEP